MTDSSFDPFSISLAEVIKHNKDQKKAKPKQKVASAASKKKGSDQKKQKKQQISRDPNRPKQKRRSEQNRKQNQTQRKQSGKIPVSSQGVKKKPNRNLARGKATPQKKRFGQQQPQPRSNQAGVPRRKRSRRAPETKEVKITVPNEESGDDKKRKREEVAETSDHADYIPLEQPRRKSDDSVNNAQKRGRRNEQESKNVDVALFEEFLAWKKEREIKQQEGEAVQHTRKIITTRTPDQEKGREKRLLSIPHTKDK